LGSFTIFKALLLFLGSFSLGTFRWLFFSWHFSLALFLLALFAGSLLHLTPRALQ